jgi:hypothetical protein
MIAKPGFEKAIASWDNHRCEKRAKLKAINENRICVLNAVDLRPDTEILEILKRWLTQDISELSELIKLHTI